MGVEVGPGVREGVRVGPVAVGNGPIRAREVSAMDVRVLFARAKSSSHETDGGMMAKRYTEAARKKIKRPASRI